MKMTLRVLLTTALMAVAQHAYAGESCKTSVISGFDADTFYQDPEKLVASFRESPFNTVATTIAWSVVEKQQGKIDLSMYYPRLDALTKAGYCLIILMDTSGRSMRSDVAKLLVQDLESIPVHSRPGWVSSAAPNSNAVDFFGGLSPTFDFEDTQALRLVRDFYRTVLPLLQRRYGHKLVGVAPCVTSECEIKYTQSGFKWQSYGPKSQQAFHKYLTSIGLPANDMPMMNYGNHLANGNPKPQPLYPHMQMFRELSLRNYACSLTGEIRRAGIQSIGYFGQTFAFPDGIYATGAIEKASRCFDIAAIDYNFYNGYGVENKPDIARFLTDYALTLGYKKVLVGLYMERFRSPTTLKVDPRGYDVLRASLRGIESDLRILGIEIGNLTGQEFRPLMYVKDEVQRMQRPAKVAPAARRVAIYASITNSYLWEGDWSNDRQIMQDDILATYAALKSIKGVHVEILTDEQAQTRPWSLSDYDLIVLPHVTTMPPTARAALIRYIKLGGSVMSDMRADDYQADGSVQKDEALSALLGVAAKQAFDRIDLVEGPSIEKQRQYVTGFVLAPAPGFGVMYRKAGGKGEGLIVWGKRTSVFGFMPLLVEGPARQWARHQFENEVRRLIN